MEITEKPRKTTKENPQERLMEPVGFGVGLKAWLNERLVP